MKIDYIFLGFLLLIGGVIASSVEVKTPINASVYENEVQFIFFPSGFTNNPTCSLYWKDALANTFVSKEIQDVAQNKDNIYTQSFSTGKYFYYLHCNDGIDTITTQTNTFYIEKHEPFTIFIFTIALSIFAYISIYLFVNMNAKHTAFSWLFLFTSFALIFVIHTILHYIPTYLNYEITTSELLKRVIDSMYWLPYILLIILLYFLVLIIWNIYTMFKKSKEW